MARGEVTADPTRKYLVMKITYIVEPDVVNMDEVLDKLRETGAAGVADVSVEELTVREVHERTR